MRSALLVVLATCSFAQDPLAPEERARFHRALHPLLFGDDEAASAARAEVLAIAEGHDLTSALDALRAGPLLPDDAADPRPGEQRSQHGAVTSGYAFEWQGRQFGYAVALPEGHDRTRPCALLLDPGHGSGADQDQAGKAEFLAFYHARAAAAGCEDWLVVRSEIVELLGAGGRWGKAPEAEVVPVFLALLRDVSSRYAVDPDRVFVTGLSQTGFWAWTLGAARADRWAGLIPMASVTWQIEPCAENLRNLRIHALHGSQDEVCRVGPVRLAFQLLSAIAPDFRYVEVEGAGHDGRVFARVSDGLAWMRDARRDPLPRSVSKSLSTLHDPWCYWLRIDELTELGSPGAGAAPTGGVDAEVEGQTVRLWSEGVERLSVLLSPRLVDLSQTVRIEWNGRSVHRGRVETDLGLALDLARARGDWGAVFPALIELH